MPSLFENYGYGKYCGLGMYLFLNILHKNNVFLFWLKIAISPSGYGCQSLEEPGCDPIDDCCKIHDACVNSYCASCLCNIRLVRCLQGLNTTAGFEPCKFSQCDSHAPPIGQFAHFQFDQVIVAKQLDVLSWTTFALLSSMHRVCAVDATVWSLHLQPVLLALVRHFDGNEPL